jgi:micrococcal nuclease
MYEYKATVVRIIDGDTVRLNVDVGFFLHFQENFRLLGIDTPELRGPTRPQGLQAKEYLESILPLGAQCQIETYKTGKYGRWLTRISYQDTDINAEMVATGHAKPYMA